MSNDQAYMIWKCTGPEWNPTPGAPVNHVFVAKPSSKAYTQRTGLALGAGELVYSLVFSLTPVTAMPDKLTACVGDDALATLAAMGLTQVEVHV